MKIDRKELIKWMNNDGPIGDLTKATIAEEIFSLDAEINKMKVILCEISHSLISAQSKLTESITGVKTNETFGSKNQLEI